MSTAVKREGEFTFLPLKEKVAARRDKCAICKTPYGRILVVKGWKGPQRLMLVRQAIDHVIPRRLAAGLVAYEHDQRNLVSLCSQCHGAKKTAEDRIFQGNLLGYLQELNRLGWPASILLRAAKYCGIKEVEKLTKGAA